jgi:hypothetical protein
MGIKTDFSGAPYFDDFDENKNFHRVLFKPSFAVQARELTQLQTILQNQIERFGDNILVEGTIIKGGNFVEEDPLPYVKISDNNVNNQSVLVNRLVGRFVLGTVTGVRAFIIAAEPGLETQAPNLNTIFVRYLTTNDDNKVFNNSENLQILDEDDNVLETVTVAGTSDPNPVGNGYGVRCGDGIIFQKGHFVRFEDDLTVVSKYDQNPNNIVVGFETLEETVSSDQDTSLLDNSESFNNFNAPGADRLRLIPRLVAKTKAEAAADENFFAIQEYQSGRVVRRKLTTEYNVIQKMIEKRDFELRGNELINPFALKLQDSVHNFSSLSCIIGPGLAYVAGKRVETLGDITIDFPKATETNVADDQAISINYGNYIVTENYTGVFAFKTLEQVELLDSSLDVVATANIRNITQQRDGNFRFYIFNVEVQSGKTFNDARSIVSTTSNGSADIVTVDNRVQLVDFSLKRLLFPIGKSSVKGLDLDNTSYTYRTSNTNLESTTGGEIDIFVPAEDRFPYSVGSTLTEDQKLDLLIISNANSAPYSTGEVIDISGNNAIVSVQTSTQLKITLATPPAAALSVTGYYNAIKDVTQVNNKNLDTIYVKIDTDTHYSNTSGVYSLGVPDAYSIEGIWRVTGNTEYSDEISEDVEDVTNKFNFFPNQKDAFYSLSYVASAAGFEIEEGDKFLIKAKTFRKTNSQNSFFTVDSYPIDDVSTILPADKIRTEQIPVYRTENSAKIWLRDVIDFRPYAVNTAVYSATIQDATENPSQDITFGSVPFNVSVPGLPVLTAYDYYLPRIDLLIIDERGNFVVVNGVPSESPVAPIPSSNAFILAQIHVNAFPSIPSSRAIREQYQLYTYIFRIAKRRTLDTQVKRIENRLRNLELYTSLSILEKAAADLTVKDSLGLDRFKSGILVDNFEDFSIANLSSREFSASIDPAYKEVAPKFRTYPIDLKIHSANNVINYGETAVLNHTESAIIEQPYATNTRSATTNFWRFRGSIEIFPNSDTTVDTVRAPDFNLSVDLETPFSDFVEAINEFIPLQTVSSSVVDRNTSSTSVRVATPTEIRTTLTSTTSVTTETLTRELQVNTASEERQIGDFVSDVSFNPFMRSRDIQIRVFGLRPNTKFYFFFDGRDVNPHVATGALSGNTVVRTEAYGNTYGIRSNPQGVLYAVFRIPAEEFFVGDRKLELYDVPNYNDRANASASAEVVYHGFNIGVEKTNLTLSTRIPELNVTSSIDRSTSTSSTSRTEITLVPPPPAAPIPEPQTCSGTRRLFSNRGADVPVVQTINLGTFTGTAGFAYNLSSGRRGVFTLTWNGQTVTSGTVTGVNFGGAGIGSLTIEKTARDPQTATVTFIPETSGTAARIFTICPTQPSALTAAIRNAINLVDPIAQTFIIEPDQSTDNSVFLTGADLYFARKSLINGVTVEIREVENGYPTGISVPFSRTHLTSDQVVASESSAAAATRVTFRTPVSVKTGIEYAIVIQPDANDPDYLLWISRVGNNDIDSGLAITQDTNAGMIFTSTNNKTWTPYQDENLKFILYKAEFTATEGFVELTNPDNEFFTLLSDREVSFIEGEKVYIDPEGSYATGTVSIISGNTTIVGTGTLFPNEYTVGEHIVIDETGEVLRIASIANNTFMTVSDIPLYDIEVSDHFRTVTGTVSYYNPGNPITLILENSSAKTGLVFTEGSTIVGSESGESAVISVIKDQPISYMQTNILRNNFTRTSTELRATRLYDGVTSYEKNLQFSDNNYLTSRPTFIRSKTKEILAGGQKSFVLRVDMKTRSTDTSPFIDQQISNAMLYEYIVNNDSTLEFTEFGNAKSKYISRKVELADGLDAEDIRVLVTAHQPPGTKIEVWAKFQSETDENVFDDCRCISWTRLQLRDNREVFSSAANRFDFVELEYVLGDQPLLETGTGAFLLNGTDFTYIDRQGGIHNNYKFFAIKIVMLADNHSVVPRVKDMRAIAVA